MNTITPILNDKLNTPLYLQLYGYVRNAILAGDILPGEKLPSLRALSKSIKLSVTTVELAYNQLLVEGYIHSKPQSGYYASSIPSKQGNLQTKNFSSEAVELDKDSLGNLDETQLETTYFDPACFDFVKWKKCMNKILTDYADYLYLEGDPRGEAPLRYEISKYLYQARGVRCTSQQIVIGAGTQQLTSLLCIILNRMGIEYVAFEEPGYLPVRDIFKDRGFKMTSVPVKKDGIAIEKLPANIKSTAYVSPSNQFPTGSVMPIARCYELLNWAKQNSSLIIEDDYNSELRYFGRAVPSLQGLDKDEQVVYLGSFSSTLFPAIKISYMVLPKPMLKLFEEELSAYTQTCSKTEQLTLALYMEKGLYQINIKKLRNLYAQKIQVASTALRTCCGDRVKILSNTSGLHMLLDLAEATNKTAAALCQQGIAQGLPLLNVSASGGFSDSLLIFYYTRIPLDQINLAIQAFAELL